MSGQEPDLKRADIDQQSQSFDEEAQALRARQDPRAFAPLYEAYLDDIYRYCYRRLGGREAAEDATSQVFFQALRGLSSYRQQPFRAWLFRIAHNVVIDQYRRRRPSSQLDAVDGVADGRLGPEELAIGGDEQRQLRQAISRLSGEQQQVIELRLAGLTGVEIAAVLGRTPDSVKMLQYRAMQRLRQLLPHPAYDPKDQNRHE